MSETRTDIGEIGEFGIIDRLTNGISLKNETSIFGVGDDAAVIDGGPDEFLLVSTDTLVEGVHFNLMYMPLKHLGYKAVAVNVSDITKYRFHCRIKSIQFRSIGRIIRRNKTCLPGI